MKNQLRFETKISYFFCIVFFILSVLSIITFGKKYTNPESYSSYINAIDEKKGTVEKLAGSAAATSAAITLMPGDFGTPIADKLVDFSNYFLIILSALYIEKFLVSVSGILAFDILLPIGFIIAAFGILSKPQLKKLGFRLIALGLILFALVPCSLLVSNYIEAQYGPELEQTIDSANQNAEILKGTADRSEDSTPWNAFIENIKGGSATILEKIESILNSFIDIIAMYIITTCIIPVATLALGLWAVKILIKLDFAKAPPLLHESPKKD